MYYNCCCTVHVHKLKYTRTCTVLRILKSNITFCGAAAMSHLDPIRSGGVEMAGIVPPAVGPRIDSSEEDNSDVGSIRNFHVPSYAGVPRMWTSDALQSEHISMGSTDIKVKSIIDWNIGKREGMSDVLVSFLADQIGSFVHFIRLIFFTNPVDILIVSMVSRRVYIKSIYLRNNGRLFALLNHSSLLPRRISSSHMRAAWHTI